ncbi:MAG: glutamate-1-semialdehyde 2,1-aminomutase [Phycisphaerales bacterium]
MQTDRSRILHKRASAVIPGGVNSPVRAFSAVDADPLHIVRGEGPYLFDADGNRYIDLVGGWGAAILGHAHPAVNAAIRTQARLGTSYGFSNPLEAQLAEHIAHRVPSAEAVRFVNSGTEAVMSAVRLARAATRRDLIVRFQGNYHGHADGLIGDTGSGALTLNIHSVPGVPAAARAGTLALPYNDPTALRAAFSRFGEQIAAVILEPIAGNMGLVLPEAEFLEAVRALTQAHGSLLILDEVMTGFRVARGGAQTLLGITPDLTTFGKIIGGGLPVGAFAGRRDLMHRIAPLGPVYQAGTASGNPLTMAAGVATLDALTPHAYATLHAASRRLAEGLRECFAHSIDAPVVVNSVAGMLGVFFGAHSVRNRDDAQRADHAAYAHFFRAMLARGVLLPPSGFEAWFLSLAHTDHILDRILEDASHAASQLPVHAERSTVP